MTALHGGGKQRQHDIFEAISPSRNGTLFRYTPALIGPHRQENQTDAYTKLRLKCSKVNHLE